jgi:uncharacterized protein (TIGR03032 family)
VTELIDQDRCHLNGLALDQGKPKYVTALAQTDTPAGWRDRKRDGGCVIDVQSNEVVACGLSMPHSPRIHQGKLWVLDSGNGALATIDPGNGAFETIEKLPGYTRGLAFAGQFAFVGLSKIRETNVFGGLAISEGDEPLRCGIGVVDLISGKTVSTFQFHSGIDEIFAVDIIAGNRNPALFGLIADKEDEPEVWIVPPP